MLKSLLFNLTLLVTLHYVLAQSYRSWPVAREGLGYWSRLALFSVTPVLLMLVPAEIQEGIFIDMRSVPGAFVTLVYGPLAGVLVTLPVALYRLWLGGSGVVAAMSSLISVLVISSLLRHVMLRRPGSWLHWKWIPVVFCLNGVALLLLPDGLNLFTQVYPALLLFNTVGAVVGWGILRDRFATLRLTRDWRAAAVTDALTGLANRRQFDEDASHLEPGDVLMLIDLDHFKRVNDTFGHQVGDDVLREVARRLTGEGRGRDRAYRYGGEEFAMIFRAVPEGAIPSVAERLRLAVAAQMIPATNERVTVSIGAVAFSRVPVSTLLARADTALYAAKEGGRDQVQVWKKGGELMPEQQEDPVQPDTDS
ncbi:GGDEF domain-containing protein [Deinococcus knuensis]|uniref:GGDEF domain-containing protein n=1 Tax=Deinococcus knuensis TaxID=1837380 RepID=A0ABQ2SEV7_9DEIO|nr:diguanylate cyclase [Deinococcus knuensis]GGS25464.1 GGDEF domain-containing protein [Deinococcus knuensis]